LNIVFYYYVSLQQSLSLKNKATRGGRKE